MKMLLYFLGEMILGTGYENQKTPASEDLITLQNPNLNINIQNGLPVINIEKNQLIENNASKENTTLNKKLNNELTANSDSHKKSECCSSKSKEFKSDISDKLKNLSIDNRTKEYKDLSVNLSESKLKNDENIDINSSQSGNMNLHLKNKSAIPKLKKFAQNQIENYKRPFLQFNKDIQTFKNKINVPKNEDDYLSKKSSSNDSKKNPEKSLAKGISNNFVIPDIVISETLDEIQDQESILEDKNAVSIQKYNDESSNETIVPEIDNQYIKSQELISKNVDFNIKEKNASLLSNFDNSGSSKLNPEIQKSIEKIENSNLNKLNVNPKKSKNTHNNSQFISMKSANRNQGMVKTTDVSKINQYSEISANNEEEDEVIYNKNPFFGIIVYIMGFSFLYLLVSGLIYN